MGAVLNPSAAVIAAPGPVCPHKNLRFLVRLQDCARRRRGFLWRGGAVFVRVFVARRSGADVGHGLARVRPRF